MTAGDRHAGSARDERHIRTFTPGASQRDLVIQSLLRCPSKRDPRKKR